MMTSARYLLKKDASFLEVVKNEGWLLFLDFNHVITKEGLKYINEFTCKNDNIQG